MCLSFNLSGGFVVSNFPPTLWLTLAIGDDYRGLIFVLNFILRQVTWTFGNRDDIDPQPIYWQIFDRWVKYNFAVRDIFYCMLWGALIWPDMDPSEKQGPSFYACGMFLAPERFTLCRQSGNCLRRWNPLTKYGKSSCFYRVNHSDDLETGRMIAPLSGGLPDIIVSYLIYLIIIY